MLIAEEGFFDASVDMSPLCGEAHVGAVFIATFEPRLTHHEGARELRGNDDTIIGRARRRRTSNGSDLRTRLATGKREK